MVVLFNCGIFLNGTWMHPYVLFWDFFPDCSGNAIFSGHFGCGSCMDRTPSSYGRNWRISNSGWTFGQQAWRAVGKNMFVPLCVLNGTVLVRGTRPSALLTIPPGLPHPPSPMLCLCSSLPWLSLLVPIDSVCTCFFSGNCHCRKQSRWHHLSVTQQIILGQTWSWVYPKVWHGVKCFIPQSLCKIHTGLSLFWLGIS